MLISVGNTVRFELPEDPNIHTGKVVEINGCVIAIESSDVIAERSDALNQMAWPGCPSGVLLLHRSFIKSVE